MTLLLNGISAALRTNQEIEFVRENRLFTEAEDYSLEIELPLNSHNRSIFGNIHRQDFDKEPIYFDAVIIDNDFSLTGAAVVTDLTEIAVKLQFLGGRSWVNFYPEWDKIYLNELELGSWPDFLPDGVQTAQSGSMSGRPRPVIDDSTPPSYITPTQAWLPGNYVALPWVNNTSGIVQNVARYTSGQWAWKVEPDDSDDLHYHSKLSWQPRLSWIVAQIFAALGYSFDYSSWLSDWTYSSLYVMNCLPEAWNNRLWASSLPHWSITEFISKLEDFLCCQFVINHRDKSVIFRWTSFDGQPVELTSIVDEYQVNVSKDDDSGYFFAQNLKYSDGGHHLSKFYDCGWFFKSALSHTQVVDVSTLSGLCAAGAMPFGNNSLLYHTLDTDDHLALYVINRINVNGHYDDQFSLVPLNHFGAIINDSEHDDEAKEFDIIPVCIGDTDDEYGFLPFLDIPDSDGSGGTAIRGRRPGGPETAADDEVVQYWPVTAILQGEQEKKSYFDKLFVAIWDGNINVFPKLPHAHVDSYEISSTHLITSESGPQGSTIFAKSIFTLTGLSRSLRLTARNSDDFGHRFLQLPKINARQKFVYNFLSSTVPSLNSIFYIRGRRYLCGKLTFALNTSRSVRLIKGEFYKIVD